MEKTTNFLNNQRYVIDECGEKNIINVFSFHLFNKKNHFKYEFIIFILFLILGFSGLLNTIENYINITPLIIFIFITGCLYIGYYSFYKSKKK